MGRTDERESSPARWGIDSAADSSTRWRLRHPLPVRLAHWINVLCFVVLAVSGFQIYTGRQWAPVGRWHHFIYAWLFAANGLLFTAYSLFSGRLFKELLPNRDDLQMTRSALRSALPFRRREEADAARYSLPQKIVYTGVIFGLGPLILFSGLAMSARVDALLPILLTLFGSRQTARTIHFGVTVLLIAYTLLHLFMIATTGFRNNLLSIVTGRRRMPSSDEESKQ